MIRIHIKALSARDLLDELIVRAGWMRGAAAASKEKPILSSHGDLHRKKQTA